MTVAVLTDAELDAVSGGFGPNLGLFTPVHFHLHLADLVHFATAFHQNTGIQIPVVTAHGNLHLVSQSNGGLNILGSQVVVG